jgi:hypothetical protein
MSKPTTQQKVNTSFNASDMGLEMINLERTVKPLYNESAWDTKVAFVQRWPLFRGCLQNIS